MSLKMALIICGSFLLVGIVIGICIAYREKKYVSSNNRRR